MRSLFLTLSILFIACAQIFPQFQEGYIITNKNDTLFGFVEFADKGKTPEVCNFITALDEPVKTYNPGEIKAFRYLEGKYFVSREIIIDSVASNVYLEWLIKGKASILSYAPNRTQIQYFILLENDSIYELENTKQMRELNGRNFEIEKKEYKGVLTAYLSDCPSIFSDIRTSSFNSKSFVKIAKEYHETTCDTEECIIYADESRKLKFSVGFALNTFSPRVTLNDDLPEDLYASQTFGYGLALDISNLSFISNRLSIRTKIVYNNILYSYDAENLYWADDDDVMEVKTLKIPLQFTYSFFNTKLTPYLSVGVTPNIRIDYKELNHLLVNHVTSHYDYEYGLSPFQIGYGGALGVKYAFSSKYALSLECNYERGIRFFGTYADDNTQISSLIFQTSFLYNIN